MSITTSDNVKLELGEIPAGFGFLDKVLKVTIPGNDEYLDRTFNINLETSDIMHLLHMLAQ